MQEKHRLTIKTKITKINFLKTLLIFCFTTKRNSEIAYIYFKIFIQRQMKLFKNISRKSFH